MVIRGQPKLRLTLELAFHHLNLLLDQLMKIMSAILPLAHLASISSTFGQCPIGLLQYLQLSFISEVLCLPKRTQSVRKIEGPLQDIQSESRQHNKDF
jgi:hypothetical protein